MSFDRRGIVLAPVDLQGMVDTWLEWLSEAELNVLGLHSDVEGLKAFIASDEGKRCLSGAESRGIVVEYEIHAMAWLLPRGLHADRQAWFRMDDNGERVPDANLCTASPDALARIAERAVEVAKALQPVTDRYYLWADDAQPWCACPDCRDLSPSDQNVRAMNAMAEALVAYRSTARLAYLAYWNTLNPPASITPSPALFLEYAPIRRESSRPLDDPSSDANAEHLSNLRRLAAAFDMTGSQILEYWIDASRFSGWKRPSIQIPFYADAIRSDVRTYSGLGFDSATSFGVYLDADYVRRYGKPPITEYGRLLASK